MRFELITPNQKIIDSPNTVNVDHNDKCRETGVDKTLFDDQFQETISVNVIRANSSRQQSGQSYSGVQVSADDGKFSGIQYIDDKESQADKCQRNRQNVIETLFA